MENGKLKMENITGTQFLEHHNGKIAYDDTGRGPLVVCAPSMGDLRQEYRFLAPQLVQAGYRVVTMDLRGLGESSTTWDDFSVAGVGRDLLALVRRLNAGPATLIGDSMAGGAAVWAAAEAPECVARLVLLDPFVRGESTFFNRLFFGTLFSRPWGPAAWATYYASLYPTRKPQDFPAYLAALRANLQAPGRMEALQRMLAASKRASEERLGRVKAPGLVLFGSKDPDFKDPAAEAAWVAHSLGGEFRLIDGAGHYPHAELPELTTPLILSFLHSL
jgi:pimeloyl-ACP methyl ester carboxylesterase